MIGSNGLVATVLKTSVVRGRIVCDCQRLGTPPRVFGQIPVLIQGGSATRGFFVPPAVGAQVMIQHADDIGPYIEGTIGATDMGLSATPQDDSGDTTLDADSVGMLNAGAQIVEDRFGAIRLTPAQGKNVLIQATGAGVVEVSRDGDASDRAALTAPLVAALQDRDGVDSEIVLKINEIIAYIAGQALPAPAPILPLLANSTPVSSDTLGSAVLRISPATPAQP